MTLSTTLQVFTLCSLLVAGGWMVKDYEIDHKPQFQVLWDSYMYEKCLAECRASQLVICQDLQIPEYECPIDCSHCEEKR
jgi:hypothetical protein